MLPFLKPGSTFSVSHSSNELHEYTAEWKQTVIFLAWLIWRNVIYLSLLSHQILKKLLTKYLGYYHDHKICVSVFLKQDKEMLVSCIMLLWCFLLFGIRLIKLYLQMTKVQICYYHVYFCLHGPQMYALNEFLKSSLRTLLHI